MAQTEERDGRQGERIPDTLESILLPRVSSFADYVQLFHKVENGYWLSMEKDLFSTLELSLIASDDHYKRFISERIQLLKSKEVLNFWKFHLHHIERSNQNIYLEDEKSHSIDSQLRFYARTMELTGLHKLLLTPSEETRCYLDMGCTPGALSSLLQRAGWAGCGVTLPESQETYPMIVAPTHILPIDCSAENAFHQIQLFTQSTYSLGYDLINLSAMYSDEGTQKLKVELSNRGEIRDLMVFRKKFLLFRTEILCALYLLKKSGTLILSMPNISLQLLFFVLDSFRNLFSTLRVLPCEREYQNGFTIVGIDYAGANVDEVRTVGNILLASVDNFGAFVNHISIKTIHDYTKLLPEKTAIDLRSVWSYQWKCIRAFRIFIDFAYQCPKYCSALLEQLSQYVYGSQKFTVCFISLSGTPNAILSICNMLLKNDRLKNIDIELPLTSYLPSPFSSVPPPQLNINKYPQYNNEVFNDSPPYDVQRHTSASAVNATASASTPSFSPPTNITFSPTSSIPSSAPGTFHNSRTMGSTYQITINHPKSSSGMESSWSQEADCGPAPGFSAPSFVPPPPFYSPPSATFQPSVESVMHSGIEKRKVQPIADTIIPEKDTIASAQMKCEPANVLHNSNKAVVACSSISSNYGSNFDREVENSTSSVNRKQESEKISANLQNSVVPSSSPVQDSSPGTMQPSPILSHSLPQAVEKLSQGDKVDEEETSVVEDSSSPIPPHLSPTISPLPSSPLTPFTPDCPQSNHNQDITEEPSTKQLRSPSRANTFSFVASANSTQVESSNSGATSEKIAATLDNTTATEVLIQGMVVSDNSMFPPGIPTPSIPDNHYSSPLSSNTPISPEVSNTNKASDRQGWGHPSDFSAVSDTIAGGRGYDRGNASVLDSLRQGRNSSLVGDRSDSRRVTPVSNARQPSKGGFEPSVDNKYNINALNTLVNNSAKDKKKTSVITDDVLARKLKIEHDDAIWVDKDGDWDVNW